MSTPPPDHRDEETEPPPVPSFRRLWKRHDGGHGSTQLALKAMGVLYDAGAPLTRDELEARLLPLLDPYQRSYLEAWHLRRKALIRNALRKHKRRPEIVERARSTISTGIQAAVHGWVGEVFLRRVYGQSLVRDPDGRYRPGPKAPRVLTIDGRLVAYTPEARQELTTKEHEDGRTHLALLEWTRLTKKFDLTTPATRAQVFIMLLRRWFIGPNLDKVKGRLDERLIAPHLEQMMRVTESPGIQRRVIHQMLETLWSDNKDLEEIRRDDNPLS
jgi:hypothetical protein